MQIKAYDFVPENATYPEIWQAKGHSDERVVHYWFESFSQEEARGWMNSLYQDHMKDISK